MWLLNLNFKLFVWPFQTNPHISVTISMQVMSSAVILAASMSLSVLRDIWFVSSTGQTCPEGRSMNRTQVLCEVLHPTVSRKTREIDHNTGNYVPYSFRWVSMPCYMSEFILTGLHTWCNKFEKSNFCWANFTKWQAPNWLDSSVSRALP